MSFLSFQVDAVRVIHNDKLFKNNPDLEIFEKNFKDNLSSLTAVGSSDKCIDQVKQPCHTVESVKLIEYELKNILERLVFSLFGQKLKYKWVSYLNNIESNEIFNFNKKRKKLKVFLSQRWTAISHLHNRPGNLKYIIMTNGLKFSVVVL